MSLGAPTVPMDSAGRAPWLVLAAAALLFFWQLGARPLYATDEGRYALAGREMLESGKWIVPTLTGVPYLDKPPMMYWLEAAGMAVFGKNEFGARFFMAAVALFGVWLAFLLGKETAGSGAGVATAAILASSALYVILSRILLTDMLLSVAILGAYTGFWRAWKGKSGAMAMWVSLALAFLSKGPVGPALFVFGAAPCWWLAPERPPLKSFRPVLGPLVWALIALPWTVTVCMKVPSYFEFFFWRENVQALGSSSVHHPKRWYYSLYGSLGGFAPWTLLLPAALAGAWKEVRAKGRAADPALLLALCWAGTTLAVFTLSSSKLPTYFLPMMPALALLVARSLCAPDGTRRSAAWTLGALAALAPVAAVVALIVDKQGLVTFWIPIAAVAAAAGFAAAARFLILGRPPAALQAAVAGLAIAALPGALALGPFHNRRSPASIIARNADALRSADAILNDGDRVGFVEWALRVPVTYLGNPHDFLSGRNLAPDEGRFLNNDQIPAFLDAHPRTFLLMAARKRKDVQKEFPSFREVDSDQGHVLLISTETR
ncbi:MAG: glycosyl transferase family [Planctomycetota bacterium]|nr:MAG: glycosyl transferase family [Planctomycetota bacterium]